MFWFFIATIFSCNEAKTVKFHKPITKFDTIYIPNTFINAVGENGVVRDLFYNQRLIKLNGKPYFSTVNKSTDRLLAFCLLDSSFRSIKINIPKNRNGLIDANYFFTTEENKVTYFNVNAGHLSYYKLVNDEFKVNSIDTLIGLDKSKYFYMMTKAELIKTNDGNKYVLNYGMRDKRVLNYIDSCNLMTYSIGKSIKKIGNYPKKYYSTIIPEYYSPFKMLNDSTCVYTYSMANEIKKVNINTGKVVSESKFSDYKVKDFDKTKVGDIGYERKFKLSFGINLGLCVTHNGYIVLIKKLPRGILDTTKHSEYYVFDSDLNLKWSDTIKFDINPSFIEPFKDGFLILPARKKYLLYYEVK